MTTLRITHTTRYRYDRPVCFGVHQIMLRPRDGHDMRILDSSLTVSPTADAHWSYDTFGNSVGSLTFNGAASELAITSALELKRYAMDDPLHRIEHHASVYPFCYGDAESIDLAPLRSTLFDCDEPDVAAWIERAVPTLSSNSVRLLDTLCSAIHQGFRYRRREEYGVQSPSQTIRLGEGTCRDFALLFMEAARILGFAARFVTGYLYDPSTDTGPDTDAPDVRGGGSTHAWADIFIPGAGWIEFDPTNAMVASRNLVRVATTRSPAQAVPVSGSYRLNGATYLGMDVAVTVNRLL